MKSRIDETAIRSELSQGSAFFSKSKPVYTASEQADDRTVDASEQPTNRSDEPAEPTNNRTNKSTGQANDQSADTAEQSDSRPSERSDQTNKRPADRRLPPDRPTRRYAFEFYADQITTIRKLRAQKEIQGTVCSLSDLAREAFDQYLKQAETERANG